MKEASDLVITEVVQCKSNPDISTKERRIGLIFAVGAFVHSGRLTEALSRSGTQAATLQLIVRFLTELSKPEFLKQLQILELTVETILSLVQLVPKAQFQSQIHPIFAKLLSGTADDLQPEIISLALGFTKHFGYHLSSDNPQLWNRQETIFGAQSILNLSLPLTVTVRTVPRIHKVWSHLLDALLVPSATQEADFSRFINTVLASLLSSDSIDHNYLAIQVAASYLPRLNVQQTEVLLSAKLLSALFTNVSRRKSILFDACSSFVEACIFVGSQNVDIGLAILRRLTGPYGDLTVLDHFVKPGIVATLIQTLDAAHLQEYLSYVFSELATPVMPADLIPRTELVKSFEENTAASSAMDVDDISAPNENIELRTITVDPAVWKVERQEALANHAQRVALLVQATHAEVARKILNTIFFFAFYTCTAPASSGKTPKKGKAAQNTRSPHDSLLFVAENVELDQKVRTALSASLLHLIDSLKVPAEDTNGSSTDEANKKKKHTQQVDEAPFKHTHFWVFPLVQFEKSLLDDAQHFKPITGGKELDDIRSTAESLMAKIEPVLNVSDETRRVRLEAFQSLLIHLHLMINIDLEDSIQSIQDLARVFEELFMDSNKTPAKKTPSKKAKKDDDMDVDERTPEAIEVFTEILVALLLKASRSLRSVIEQNWVSFATLVSDRAFDIVLTALEEEQDAEEEGDDEDDLILQLGSDVEIGSDVENGSDDEEDGEDDDEDDEDDDDDEESGEGEDDVETMTKQKLREVLKAHGAYAGSDDEESDEEILTDEQMFAMDASLAKVVKEIQVVKETSKRKRENKMTNIEVQETEFRMRLLSLVDLYIEQQTSGSSKAKPVEAPVATPSKKTPSKSPKKAAAPAPEPVSPVSRYHTTYLNAVWPFVRIVDVIAPRKAMAPLLTRVLASVHRLIKTRLPSAETSPLTEKQVDTFYTVLRQLYAGFNQPSRPAQVDLRLGLVVFLLRLLLEQPKPDVAKMHEGFVDAVKAYADASQTAIKSRSLFTDLFPHILRRVPALQLVHLKGIGAIIAKSREGPTRGALTNALFATVTRGVVEAEVASSIEKVSFKQIVAEFTTAFKACFADAKLKGVQQRELLLRAAELFKISLAIAKGDLKVAQAEWNSEELARFTAHVLLSEATKPLPAVVLAHESFTHYLEHGKPKQTSSKYGSADEKLAAKVARREARQQKADAHATKNGKNGKKTDESLPAPAKDGSKKRKAQDSSAAPIAKKK